MDILDWNGAKAFCATVEAGSLSAAARKLGLTQPTLSRQVAALEAQLGVVLFERVGKRLVLTDNGRGLFAHAQAMSSAADAMALAAEGRSQEITGRVVVSATDAISAYVLPEIIAQIRKSAPQVTVVVNATDGISDLRRREADIAIRHIRPTESELIGRQLADMEALFFASETWTEKHGLPQFVSDIGEGDLLGYEPIDQFIEHLDKAGIAVREDQFRVVSANAVALWEMTRKGLGVGLILAQCARELPGLVRVLHALPVVRVPVWLVTHQELRTSKRVRLVFDAIAEGLPGAFIPVSDVAAGGRHPKDENGMARPTEDRSKVNTCQ